MSSLCLRSCSRAKHARRRDVKILENQKCARSLHLATHTVDAARERPLRTPVPGDVKLTIRIHCNEVKQAAHAISYIRQGRGHGIRRIQAAYTHLVRAGHKCEHAEECRTTMHAPCFSSFECPSRQNKILHHPPPDSQGAPGGHRRERLRMASLPQRLDSAEAAATTTEAQHVDPDYFTDGRARPKWNAGPATWQTHGPQCGVWPPGGTARKYVLTSWREELVQHDTAVAGELVRVSPEYEAGSFLSKYAGQVGRLTQPYGDGYWGVIFEGWKREEVLHVGEQGMFMLSYVYARGSKDALDVRHPPCNRFGKVRMMQTRSAEKTFHQKMFQ